MRAALVASVVGLIALAGCGGDAGPARIEAEGSWQGNFQTSGGTTATLAFTIQETSGAVTGNGTFTSPSFSSAETITGTYTPPTLSISLHADGFEDSNLTATVAETSMSGVLNGSGFQNQSVTLNRQ